MHETPNLYLSVCLIMVGIQALTISHNVPTLSLQRCQWIDMRHLLRPGRIPIHAYLVNKTCP